MPFKRILVPVDYSEPSRKALELALGLEGVETIEVVHVWERPPYVAEELVPSHDGSRRSLGELIRENAELEMTEFLAKVAARSEVHLAHRLLSGEPVSEILSEASKPGYDLLVVGSHGRTGMTRLLLGSVAEKVVRLSPIPVLTVPSGR
jgi:universal stress protein A